MHNLCFQLGCYVGTPDNFGLPSVFSLKKNKNKTEETSKWLDRRITSLNQSILHFKQDVSGLLLW